MAPIIVSENLRKQKLEFDLPDDLIEDTEIPDSLLQLSDESDSLDGFVIKDFTVRVVESEPDANTTSLPITEQVMIESKKLKDMIESVKDRFQVKVAREKFSERGKKEISVRAKGKFQFFDDIEANNRESGNRTIPSDNIIDSENWGSVALPKPLLDFVEPESSEEDFLNETDMRFDDVFGVDNVLEPAAIRATPAIDHKTLSQNQRRAETSPEFVQKIEDLQSPQFSDHISSDESVQEISPVHFKISDNSKMATPFAAKRDEKKFTTNPNVPTESETKTVVPETQHEKDVRQLKELLSSGALTTSMANQRFEEGVLDLLLRQSDSLWDPVVSGIPITYFIPSKNHEMGLLDTSINDADLMSPLIKPSGKKLPEYMQSLETEWNTNNESSGKSVEMFVEENYVVDDKNELLPGLSQFSYRPNVHRKKIPNIMDSESEADDSSSDGILSDSEMNFDELTQNVAEPTYDFRLGKKIDDSEMKARIIRKVKEKNKALLANTIRNQPATIENPVKIKKSVSFGDIVQHIESSHSEQEPSNSQNAGDNNRAKEWTTIDISEVNDLIQYARLAQARYKDSTTAKGKGRRERQV